MKLRRALVAAAATGAIAPLALLSAPAAFATGGTTSPTASASATETVSGSPSPTASASATETEPAPSGSVTGTASGSAPAPTGSASASATAGQSSQSPSPSPSGSTSVSPSPSASESAGPADPELCAGPDNDSVGLSEDLRSGLSGLAETIVAGSGWEDFSFDVSNRGDEEIQNIVPLIGVAAVGWDEEDYSGDITVQVRDKASGSWQTIANTGGEGGTFPAFSLGAGQSVSFQMRLSVSGEVPDALGLTGGFAQYADDEGCWIADDPNGWIYFFDILAAGSDAGDPGDAEPQTGGMADLDEVNSVQATGSLAETGSSSALPLIGLVGGFAVVAGAGAVYAVRRKKAGA
ncbi:LPXTG cell wall anchor domain-containing protein [Streptomyces sp.]|uniref:LPXTG cell wall anchor domain-containing protein n=1 Tax=Streptomyces sp. TaxID=1931 RepID=UPI002D731385|nr:LPXTG cell wall anchor domain-containing protein [Streptomyces sp.]HZF90939.1 LPXTG cell wall anchor domain-containing protein [Streptomyces sp.]